MTHYIRDYGLTAAELEAKYERSDQHPGYTRADWRRAPFTEACGDYWQWVALKLAREEDELADDNPFTLHFGSHA